MYIIFVVLIVIVCVLLSLIVLVQNPKGGGLNQSLGGVQNQVFGAKRSTDIVEKATWYLAIALLVLSLGSAWAIRSVGNDGPEKTKIETIENTFTPNYTPNQPIITSPAEGDGQPVLGTDEE